MFETIEISDKSGVRAMGLVVEETPSNFKLAYKGVTTDYPRPLWFKVQPTQFSARYKAYRVLDVTQQ